MIIVVNGFQPLTNITKRSILDVAAALDPLLITRGVCFEICKHYFHILIRMKNPKKQKKNKKENKNYWFYQTLIDEYFIILNRKIVWLKWVAKSKKWKKWNARSCIDIYVVDSSTIIIKPFWAIARDRNRWIAVEWQLWTWEGLVNLFQLFWGHKNKKIVKTRVLQICRWGSM